MSTGRFLARSLFPLPLAYRPISRHFTSATTAPSHQSRPLPVASSTRTPTLVALGVAGVGLWVGVIALATNYQRQSSSVVHGTLFTVRYDPRVRELLGDGVDYADSWPWIAGSVNHLQGKINIKFTVKGNKGKEIVCCAPYCIKKVNNPSLTDYVNITTISLQANAPRSTLRRAAVARSGRPLTSL